MLDMDTGRLTMGEVDRNVGLNDNEQFHANNNIVSEMVCR